MESYIVILVLVLMFTTGKADDGSTTSSSSSPPSLVTHRTGIDSAVESDSTIISTSDTYSFNRSIFAMDMEYFVPILDEDDHEHEYNFNYTPNIMSLFFNYSHMKATDENGCLKWSTDPHSLIPTIVPSLFKGTAELNEPCNRDADGMEEGTMHLLCKNYNESDQCPFSLTNLVCSTADPTKPEGTCQDGMKLQAARLKELTEDMVEDGCLKSYHPENEDQINSPHLSGNRTFRQSCNPMAGDDPSLAGHKCNLFALDYRTHSIEHDEKNTTAPNITACLKYSNLYCDPVLQLCLCGKGENEMKFQYDGAKNLCYMRPSFTVVQTYQCTPDTLPTNITVSGNAFTFCRCKQPANLKSNDPFIPKYFNTDNPSWWVCKGSKNFPSILPHLFVTLSILKILY